MKKINSLLIAVITCMGILIVQNSLGQTMQVDTFNTTIDFGGNPNWIISCYVPPSYNAANKYKLIICLHGLGVEPDAAESMRDFFVQSYYPPDTGGLVTNPHSPVYNAIVICPYLYGPNAAEGMTDLWTPVGDTALVTTLISYAMSTYNIDPHYIYLSGFSYGGRGALRYGLLNYWRFRGLVLFTPAIQTVDEANDLTSFYFPWQNGKYIPIYMSVGDADWYGASAKVGGGATVPIAYQHLYDSSAIATLQLIIGMPHDPPANSNSFFGVNYIDSHATSYAMNDAGISAVLEPFQEICSTSFTPVVIFQNKGINNLTSVKVNYQVDNGTIHSYSWSGNLIQLGTGKVTFPSQTISEGTHTFKAYTSMPNGVNDTVPSNDTLIESFNSISSGITTLTEGFEGDTFPPINWQLAGTDSAFGWARLISAAADFALWPYWQSGAYGQSANCIYFDNGVQGITGKRYSIRTPLFDFTNSNNPTMQFDYAYTPYSSLYSDTLIVYYSVDCGDTWNAIFSKGGLALSTTGGYSDSLYFIPTSTQWMHQTINLNIQNLIGQPEVMFSLENRSGLGNLMYLDNISINAVTGIANEMQEVDSLNVYPNPSSGNITIAFNLSNSTNVVIKVYNLQGQVIYSEEKNQCQGNYQTNIDLSNQAKGVYLLNVITDKGVQNQKIIIQ